MSSSRGAAPKAGASEGKKPSGRFILRLGIGVLVALGISYWFLYTDAHHGYHQVWPVYLFLAVGFACTCIWGYILVARR